MVVEVDGVVEVDVVVEVDLVTDLDGFGRVVIVVDEGRSVDTGGRAADAARLVESNAHDAEAASTARATSESTTAELQVRPGRAEPRVKAGRAWRRAP